LAAIETKPPASVASRLPDMYAGRCLAASSTRITRCGSKNGMTITACAIVGTSEKRGRYYQPERVRGLKIDYQLELDWLRDR
jgi:hypothetical protein